MREPSLSNGGRLQPHRAMRLGDSISSQAGANNPFLALELNGKQRDVSERIKTAKALGLTVPNSMQLLADEVTEQRSFVHAHCYTCPGLLLAAQVCVPPCPDHGRSQMSSELQADAWFEGLTVKNDPLRTKTSDL